MIKEIKGIEIVEDSERAGNISSVAWVWFGANIGILSLVFGVIIAQLGLNLSQAIAATVIGSFGSFILVGMVSVIGKNSGLPTLTSSKVAFGKSGNFVPTIVSWVNILGWEAITTVLAAWSLSALLNDIFKIPVSKTSEIICVIVVVSVSLALGYFGHRVILKFQKVASYIFGLLTVLVVVYILIKHTSLPNAKPSSFNDVLIAISIIAAGTGISWINLAGDYSRYLPRSLSSKKLFTSVVFASSVPVSVLVLAGYLLSSKYGSLDATLNPVAVLGVGVPLLFAVPLFLSACGGMILETDLACYSSGLNLLALRVPIKRTFTVFVDAAIVLGVSSYLIFVSSSITQDFENFLLLLAAFLAAFGGVVIADYLLKRYLKRTTQYMLSNSSDLFHANMSGLAALFVGSSIGLLATTCPWFKGPLAVGFIGSGSFGFVVAFLISSFVYIVMSLIIKRKTHFNSDTLIRQLEETGLSEVGASEVGASEAVEKYLRSKVRNEIDTPSRLLVVGSILVDVLLYSDTLPVRGKDIFATGKQISSGGGYNVLSAASKLGLKSQYVGNVGNGPFGLTVARDLEFKGVEAPLGISKQGDSGFTVGIVEKDGEKTFITSPGIESKLLASDLEKVHVRSGDFIYVSGYDLLYDVSGPTIKSFIEDNSIDRTIVIDPGPISPGTEELRKALKHTDILTLNETEANILTGQDDPFDQVKTLSGFIKKDGLVVLRHGDDGCYYNDSSGKVFHVKTITSVVVDTTGAGDIHTGALLAALSKGDSIDRAIMVANVAASLSTEHLGGSFCPERDEIDSKLGLVKLEMKT